MSEHVGSDIAECPACLLAVTTKTCSRANEALSRPVHHHLAPMPLACEFWIDHSEALGIAAPEMVLEYVGYLTARFGPDSRLVATGGINRPRASCHLTLDDDGERSLEDAVRAGTPPSSRT